MRVIAATNRDLEAEYRNGTFRKDLFFRLNVVTVHLPSLRERRSDIPMLAHWFLERYARGGSIQITTAAMKSLLQYDWPGNVRELENCIERAVALGDRRTIDFNDLPPAITTAAHVGLRPRVVADENCAQPGVRPAAASACTRFVRSAKISSRVALPSSIVAVTTPV